MESSRTTLASLRVVRSRALSMALALATLGAAVATSGCMPAMSADEFVQRENHPFPARSPAQVHAATVVALRTLGYVVVADDPARGTIKTAPNVISAIAQGYGSTAVATAIAIGWSISMVPIPGGTGMHAEPHPYQGGQPFDPSRLNASYLRQLFDNLYKEIDSNL